MNQIWLGREVLEEAYFFLVLKKGNPLIEPINYVITYFSILFNFKLEMFQAVNVAMSYGFGYRVQPKSREALISRVIDARLMFFFSPLLALLVLLELEVADLLEEAGVRRRPRRKARQRTCQHRVAVLRVNRSTLGRVVHEAIDLPSDSCQ